MIDSCFYFRNIFHTRGFWIWIGEPLIQTKKNLQLSYASFHFLNGSSYQFIYVLGLATYFCIKVRPQGFKEEYFFILFDYNLSSITKTEYTSIIYQKYTEIRLNISIKTEFFFFLLFLLSLLSPSVTYWPSTKPSTKRCTCVNNQKNSETGASGWRYRNITLTYGRGWIRRGCVRPQEAGNIYQPLRSGKIWHKVNF